MSDGRVLVFAYDGSIEGFFSAVFDAFVLKTLPADIFIESDIEPTLLKIHYVETDFEHAKRVQIGICKKLSERTLDMVRKAFLYDEEGKEMSIMIFLWRAFKDGANAGIKIGDTDVNRVFKMCMQSTTRRSI